MAERKGAKSKRSNAGGGSTVGRRTRLPVDPQTAVRRKLAAHLRACAKAEELGLPKPNTPLSPEEWGPLFLADYAETFSLTRSAKDLGINLSTVYKRKGYDPQFAEDLEDAKNGTRENVKAEIIRRAIEGDIEETPYYFKGDNDEEGLPIVALAGTKKVVRRSDQLLILAAKALMPELFGDRSVHYNINLDAEVDRVAESQNVPANMVRAEIVDMARRQMAEQKDEELRGVFPHTGRAVRRISG